jgi:hypothetical protein
VEAETLNRDVAAVRAGRAELSPLREPQLTRAGSRRKPQLTGAGSPQINSDWSSNLNSGHWIRDECHLLVHLPANR